MNRRQYGEMTYHEIRRRDRESGLVPCLLNVMDIHVELTAQQGSSQGGTGPPVQLCGIQVHNVQG